MAQPAGDGDAPQPAVPANVVNRFRLRAGCAGTQVGGPGVAGSEDIWQEGRDSAAGFIAAPSSAREHVGEADGVGDGSGPTMNDILEKTPAFAALRAELVECKRAVARVDGTVDKIAQAVNVYVDDTNRRMRQLEGQLDKWQEWTVAVARAHNLFLDQLHTSIHEEPSARIDELSTRIRQLEDRLKEVTEKRIGQEAMQAYQ